MKNASYDLKRTSICWKLVKGDKLLIETGSSPREFTFFGAKRCKCSDLKHHKAILKDEFGKELTISFWDLQSLIIEAYKPKTIIK